MVEQSRQKQQRGGARKPQNRVYTEFNLYDFEQVRFEENLDVEPHQAEFPVEHGKLINYGNYIGEIKDQPFVAMCCEVEGIANKSKEMTGQDYMVVRVTLVNYEGEIVLDTLVRPQQGISLQKMSQHHGITETMYSQGNTFQSVKRFLEKVLKNKCLVGANVKDDIGLLGLSKQPSIDIGFSSKAATQPTPLKSLATQELNAYIDFKPQCSIIKARVAMALFKKKKAMYTEFIEGATPA
jgi:hypothetical protein